MLDDDDCQGMEHIVPGEECEQRSPITVGDSRDKGRSNHDESDE
jgi:hypothetical protein